MPIRPAGRSGRFPAAALMTLPLFALGGCADAGLDAPVRLKSYSGGTVPVPATTSKGIEFASGAIAAHDLCAVYASLSGLQIPATPDGRRRLMMAVHDAMERSEQFADIEIRDDWQVLLQAIGDEVDMEPDTVPGGADGAEGSEVASARFMDAQRHVEDWIGANCG